MPVVKRAASAAIGILGFCSGLSVAADLNVIVSGVAQEAGEIGCALYEEANRAAFPLTPEKARQIWLPARPGEVACLFSDLAPGVYAVAVSHDLNGNRKTDTNFLGMPLEPWGVSNNARPTLRPPRFMESAVGVPSTGRYEIKIEVAK